MLEKIINIKNIYTMKTMKTMKTNTVYKKIGITAVLSSVILFSGCEFGEEKFTETLTENTKAYTQEFAKTFEGTDKVVIEEFSDIECPACKNFAPTYERLEKAFAKNKNVEFRYNHFPLESIHKYAYAGALATECAGVVGGKKAKKEYLHLAFAEKKLSTNFYRELRKNTTIGFTEKQQERFLACFNNKNTSNIIKNHKKEGSARNLKGTPTVYINGTEYAGSRNYDALFLEINSKLK